MDYSEVCFLTSKHMGGFLWFILWWLISPDVLIRWRQTQAPPPLTTPDPVAGTDPHPHCSLDPPSSGSVCFCVSKMKVLRLKILPNVTQLVCWSFGRGEKTGSSLTQLPRGWSSVRHLLLSISQSLGMWTRELWCQRRNGVRAVTTWRAPTPAALRSPVHFLPYPHFH